MTRTFRLLAAALAVAMAASLAACNTTAGMGQDISSTGKAVTTGADKVKDKM